MKPKSRLFQRPNFDGKLLTDDLRLVGQLTPAAREILADRLSEAYAVPDSGTPTRSELTTTAVADVFDVTPGDITKIVKVTQFVIEASQGDQPDAIEGILDDAVRIGGMAHEFAQPIQAFLDAVRARIPATFYRDAKRKSVARRGIPFFTGIKTSANLRGVEKDSIDPTQDLSAYLGEMRDFSAVGIVTITADSYTDSDVEFHFQLDRPELRRLINTFTALDKELQVMERIANDLTAQDAPVRARS